MKKLNIKIFGTNGADKCKMLVYFVTNFFYE